MKKGYLLFSKKKKQKDFLQHEICHRKGNDYSPDELP